jgi:hypothetical protein
MGLSLPGEPLIESTAEDPIGELDAGDQACGDRLGRDRGAIGERRRCGSCSWLDAVREGTRVFNGPYVDETRTPGNPGRRVRRKRRSPAS